uniref:Uncharacterized protein n=1 Tax=Oryza brachyantha TaxID=4533 RepID=J3KY36_ORYBR
MYKFHHGIGVTDLSNMLCRTVISANYILVPCISFYLTSTRLWFLANSCATLINVSTWTYYYFAEKSY